MKLISLNVGLPQAIETPRGTVMTAIFKQPVEGRVAVRRYNIAGDKQADLSVHGGPAKAVYAYSAGHYPYWKAALPDSPLSYGNFGENLTVDGLSEDDIHIGDRFRVGTVLLQVTQPRMPCFKLALRFGRPDMVKLFWKSNRSGIYFSIEEEGELAAGDEVTRQAVHPLRVTVGDVVALYKGEKSDPDLFRRALEAPLASSWKQGIQELHERGTH